MPEGPEFHRAAAMVASAIVGKRVREVYFAFEHLRRFQHQLAGRRVRSVEARGKAILTRFSSDLTVYSHNQLYGKWFVGPAGARPETKRQPRFAVHTNDRSALLYSASEIEVLDESGLETQRYLANLGPDVVDGNVRAADVLERLNNDAFARRRLGHLLLDQSFLAGVGNYLRSEILYGARLHPSSRPCDLSEPALRRLAKTVLTLSRRSFRTGGITNDAARVAKLKRDGKRLAEYRFFVFARAGKSCYRCGKKIVRTEVGSRRLYSCPRCQLSNR